MNKKNLSKGVSMLGTESFLDGKGASFNGFVDFLKKNTPLVITVTLAALFVYGLILFNVAVTGDSAGYLFDPEYYKTDLFMVGRWAAPLLAKLFFIKESGVYASNFISVLSIWLFSLLFCYFIAVFTKNTNRRSGFIPMALITLTYSVWTQYFLFFYQNKIQTLFIVFTLTAVYLLFDGFLSRNKIKIAAGFALSVLSFGVYQPFVPLFLCIVFIYFVLLQENSNYPPKEYALLCLKLFIVFVAAFALAAIIGGVIRSMLEVTASTYVAKHYIWNKDNVLRSIISSILGQGYIVTIGMMPFVHNLFSPIIISVYGSDSGVFGPITDLVFNSARAVGSPLLLLAAAAFIVIICINAKNRIPKGRRILYALAGFGIPCSILFLAIVSGEVIAIRILYSLPFAASFMFYHIAVRQKKILRRVLYCVILVIAFYQAQISQNMLEAAVRASDYDSIMAFDIDARIRDVLGDDKKLPVAYIGKIKHPLENQTLFNIVEAMPSNFKAWSPAYKEFLIERARFSMTIFGFEYDVPTPEQIERAYEASRDMPSYPLEGCVKKLNDVVVVKMGEDL
jgi:hypothetical protein